MIFIAKNYDGYTISIVNARSIELANAYWQGADIVPHSITCLEKDFDNINTHITGVYSLLRTIERNIGDPFKQNKIIEVVK